MKKRRNIECDIVYFFGQIVTPFPSEIFIGVNVSLRGLKPVQMK